MILISACLLGYNCKYNGGNNLNPTLVELLKNHEIFPICPEQLGGLPTPRTPCEIKDSTGKNVLLGKGKVISKEGEDFTRYFVQGAKKTLAQAIDNDIKTAILKSKSPSCGVNMIYDGSFSGRLLPGAGVTTDLLRQAGVKVFNEKEGAELERESREADKKG